MQTISSSDPDQHVVITKTADANADNVSEEDLTDIRIIFYASSL